MIVLFLFILGLIVGSFLNVVITRTIAGEDFIHGRSRCDECRKTIAWYDNVPLLSFLLLHGKCRYCKKPISIQHPVIELMTGILFVWWYVMGFAFFQLTQQPLLLLQRGYWLVVGVLLLAIVVSDWRYMIIPDYALIGLTIASLGYRIWLAGSGAMQWPDVYYAVIAGLVAGLVFLLLWVGTKGKGMGFGDVKFVVVMGFILSWQRLLVALFSAFISGSIYGMVLMLLSHKSLKYKVPFGPFLVLGTVLSLLVGNQLWGWYVNLL